MRLENKVAVVTGGGRGIGKAFCAGLAREGARVVIADINIESARAAAKELRRQGKEVIAVKTDVSSEKSTIVMAEKTVKGFGGIDILVNDAAFFASLGLGKTWDKVDVKEWDKVMSVNLRGMFLCSRAVYPHMLARGKGKIINISSTTAYRGLVRGIHYVTSKAGVLGFTRALSRELAGKNINVNAIAPGLTLSEGVVAGGGFVTQEDWAKMRTLRCSQKDLFPEDMVGAMVFLASDESDSVYGQTIVVDGGVVFV